MEAGWEGQRERRILNRLHAQRRAPRRAPCGARPHGPEIVGLSQNQPTEPLRGPVALLVNEGALFRLLALVLFSSDSSHASWQSCPHSLAFNSDRRLCSSSRSLLLTSPFRAPALLPSYTPVLHLLQNHLQMKFILFLPKLVFFFPLSQEVGWIFSQTRNLESLSWAINNQFLWTLVLSPWPLPCFVS